MTESDDLKPFLESVYRLTDRLNHGHGFVYEHIVNPDVPTSAAVLRARTAGFLPSHVRIAGDRVDTDEAFIPRPLRLPSPPTEEERQALAAATERREVDRQAEMATHLKRHADLVERHKDTPIVSTLLFEHRPHETTWPTAFHQECQGCPPDYSSDDGAEVMQSWPCPTWTTIAEQTEAQR